MITARNQTNFKKIQDLLQERGLCRADLSRMWGVSRAAVSRAINGDRPHSLLIGKLSNLLGVPLRELMLNGDKGSRKRAA